MGAEIIFFPASLEVPSGPQGGTGDGSLQLLEPLPPRPGFG